MLTANMFLALAPQVLATQPVQFQADYGATPSVETLMNVAYPAGKGPQVLGHAPEALPVLISIRPGNDNLVVPGVPSPGAETTAAIAYGLVGVDPNIPIVQQGQDYNVPADAAARMVQVLRANADEWNLDPDRIFLLGRSFGQVVALAVSLKQDHQDLGSGDPVLWQSSRPSYTIARQGPTSLSCMDTDPTGQHAWLSLFFFPTSSFANATEEMKIVESSFWWLTNPGAFQRAYTPPLCYVYEFAHGDACGAITDVHSGFFGELMVGATLDLARATGDARLRDGLFAIDNGAQVEPLTINKILLWVAGRLAEDAGGLYLIAPAGTVGPGGSNLTMNVLGGTPGGTVTFYSGTAPATSPVPGCAAIQQELANPLVLGTGVVDAAGLASVTFFVPSSSAGTTTYFQALDASGCEASNLVLHTYASSTDAE